MGIARGDAKVSKQSKFDIRWLAKNFTCSFCGSKKHRALSGFRDEHLIGECMNCFNYTHFYHGQPQPRPGEYELELSPYTGDWEWRKTNHD